MKNRQSRFSRPSAVSGWLVAVALAVCPLATSALAQSWSGGASLGVQIRGSGGPVEGALVEIRYRRPGLTAGPEARRTDAKGQANFVGITQGAWSLEIRHPDYLSFVASVRVEAGRKPEVVTQFLEASGPGRNTLKVKFLRSDRALGTAEPGTAIHDRAESSPSTKQRPTANPPADSPPPRERVALRTTPEPRPSEAEPALEPEPSEPPAVEPQPTPASSSEPEAEAAGEPPAAAPVSESAAAPSPRPSPEETLPAAEPAPSPPATPPLPDPEQAVPSEAGAGELPTPAAPAPQAAPPASAILEDSGTAPSADSARDSLTAFRDRTCFDCKPGEWAVTAQIEVTAGEPCRSPTEVAVRRAMRDVVAASSAPLAGFSGPMPADLAQPPLSLASAPARGTLARYLSASESCRLVAIVIPAGGSFTGFRLEAHDQRSGGDCTGEQECEVLRARFLFPPAVARGAGASIVYSVFENTGSEVRKAKMTGFFLPPSGWSPD